MKYCFQKFDGILLLFFRRIPMHEYTHQIGEWTTIKTQTPVIHELHADLQIFRALHHLNAPRQIEINTIAENTRTCALQNRMSFNNFIGLTNDYAANTFHFAQLIEIVTEGFDRKTLLQTPIENKIRNWILKLISGYGCMKCICILYSVNRVRCEEIELLASDILRCAFCRMHPQFFIILYLENIFVVCATILTRM